MKKTLLTTTLLVALVASTTASHAFSWSNLNPANWGTCPKCEKVCKKENPCQPKCKCKKQKCDPCKKEKCNSCEQKAQYTPCQPVAPCTPCTTPAPCGDACDRLQEVTEK